MQLGWISREKGVWVCVMNDILEMRMQVLCVLIAAGHPDSCRPSMELPLKERTVLP